MALSNFGPQPRVQPSIYFQAHLNATQSISANTNTVVNFDTVDFDTNGWWSPSNFRYTPKLAGNYTVTATVQLQTTGLTTEPASFFVWVFKNGSTFLATCLSQIDVAMAFNHSGAVTPYTVAMNGTTDYLQILGNITGTGITGATFNGNVAASSVVTYMRISKA